MATSTATTVAAYLAALPPPRREAIAAVRDVVLTHLPEGYEEAMGFGMICYSVPLADYPDTYNGQPLCYAALAAQKNFNTIYLMNAYAGEQLDTLKQGFADARLKLDMGKSCVHFKTAADLPLDTIGSVIASTTPARWIEIFEASRSPGAKKKAGAKKKKAAPKSAKKTAGKAKR